MTELQEKLLKEVTTAREAQKVQEPIHEVMRGRIAAIAFLMGFLKDPEGTLMTHIAMSKNPETFKNVYEQRFLHFAGIVAKETGADLEQIKDPKTRTKEQYEMILKLYAEEEIARLDTYMASNYYRAFEVLAPIKGKYEDPEPGNDFSIKQYAILYFFALHYSDLKPQAPRNLTEEHETEIRMIFDRMDAFYYDRTDGGAADRDGGMFLEFIRKDSPDPEKMIRLLPHVMTRPPEYLEYPIDKINSNIWEDLTEAARQDPNGQLRFALEKSGSRKEATAIYSINFDELEKMDGVKLTKSLAPFDKLVYIAASAVYAQGGNYMSTGQIYTAMGGIGKPAAWQLNKINDSLTKMGAARIYLDNTQEVSVNKGYRLFKYDAPLLPFERVSAYINNQMVESAIHLFREPPLMTFAKERNQVTTIARKLLEAPLNKTDSNLRIQDYLLERIARMKSGSGKTSRKMLYSTIYEKCQVTTRNQKSRAPKTIRSYLDYYKECGWIKGYKDEADGVMILL